MEGYKMTQTSQQLRSAREENAQRISFQIQTRSEICRSFGVCVRTGAGACSDIRAARWWWRWRWCAWRRRRGRVARRLGRRLWRQGRQRFLRLTAAALMRVAEALRAAAVIMAADIGGIRSMAAVRARRLRRERVACRRGISNLNRMRIPNILRPGIIPGRNRLMRECPRWDA